MKITVLNLRRRAFMANLFIGAASFAATAADSRIYIPKESLDDSVEQINLIISTAPFPNNVYLASDQASKSPIDIEAACTRAFGCGLRNFHTSTFGEKSEEFRKNLVNDFQKSRHVIVGGFVMTSTEFYAGQVLRALK